MIKEQEDRPARYCVDCGNELSDVEYGLYFIVCEACVKKAK